MPLLESRSQYKPFEYPWAYDMWKRQQQIHWMPEEVPLGEDCRDWAQKLDATELGRPTADSGTTPSGASCHNAQKMATSRTRSPTTVQKSGSLLLAFRKTRRRPRSAGWPSGRGRVREV